MEVIPLSGLRSDGIKYYSRMEVLKGVSKRQRILWKIEQRMVSFTRVLSYIAAACLIVMAMLATANVLTSKIFSYGIPSAVDWGTYLLIPVVFLSIGHNLLCNGLIQVDFLSKRFPPVVNAIIEIISNIAGCGISCVITWRQFVLAARYFSTRKVSSFMPLHFLIWPFCVILGVGTALMAVIFIWQIIRIVLKKDFLEIAAETGKESER